LPAGTRLTAPRRPALCRSWPRRPALCRSWPRRPALCRSWPRHPTQGEPGSVRRRTVSEVPCECDTRPLPRVSTAAPGARW